MKVAFYLPRGVFGGGERVIITLAREFQKRDIEVLICTRDTYDYSLVPARVIKLDCLKNKILQIFDACRFLKDEKVSHIIVFHPDTILYCASVLIGSKYVYSLRVDPQQVNWSKFMYRHIIKNCYKIVFQTQKVQSFFDENVRSHSRVIFNPILDENLPEVQDTRAKIIIMVGRLSKEKNYPMALKAFANVKRNGYKLHIYGVGPMEGNLRQLVSELGLLNDVIFEGQVKKVVNHIKDADIFLLTSNFEGMPNALIEGMAMGLACISTDFPSGAAKELIKDGEDGFVVPMNDVDALSSKLEILIEHEETRRLFQSKASGIRDRQGIDTIVKQWIEFIE